MRITLLMIIFFTFFQPNNAVSEQTATEILSSLPLILPHIQSNIYRQVAESVSDILTRNFAIFNEVQCAKSNPNVNSQILNKIYIINEQLSENTETLKISVGPVIIGGFSNITEITWRYASSAGGHVHKETILNIGVLSIKSDWIITSSKGNVFNTTEAFKINNAQFAYTYDQFRGNTTFDANMEVIKNKQPQSVLDDIVCADLNKLIKNSLVKAQYNYNKNRPSY